MNPPSASPLVVPTATVPPDRRGSLRVGALVAGADAALIISVLGLMYTLLAYSALGPVALPIALVATTVGLLAGGIGTVLASRDLSRVAGPTATGALVVSGLVRDLQGVPAARGDVGLAIAAVVVAVAISGFAQVAFARLRLGSLLKFVPYPVLMGFANTVALLLIISMIPAALGHAYTGHLSELPRWFVDWRPTSLVVATCGTAVGWLVLRRWPRIPASFSALVAATVVHYAIAATCTYCTSGPMIALGEAATPDPSQLGGALAVFSMDLAYWRLVLQAALVLSILNTLFSLLGAAQLTQPRDPPIDGNRLLQSLGVGNLCAGLLLGLPIAINASPSRALRRGEAHPLVAMITYLVVVAAIFCIGKRWFDRMPMAAVAAAVFIGTIRLFDTATGPLLRQTWSRGAARRTGAGPLAVAALVIVVGLFEGLAASLFVGALAAVCLLAVEMRRSVVVAVDDGRTRRSRRVRPAADNERLATLGERIRVVVLGHWLYFGTADELGNLLEGPSTARWLLLDLRSVAGIDVTAARSLLHAAERLRERDIHLVLAGLPEGDPRRRTIALFDAHPQALTLTDDLDSALERAEDDLLGPPANDGDHAFGFPGLSREDSERLEAWSTRVTLAAGDVLFRAGDRGDALYAIGRGRLTIWMAEPDRPRRRLLTFGDGGVFGELAVLDGRPRSADAVADTDCVLWRLDRDRLDALSAADPALHAKVLTALARHLSQRLRDATRLLDLG